MYADKTVLITGGTGRIQPGGVKVPRDFRYSSEINEHRLDIPKLRELLKNMPTPETYSAPEAFSGEGS